MLRPTCLRSEIDGLGGSTSSVSEAVFPFTVCALMMCETLPLVLLYVPTTGAVTLTVTVHVPPPAMVPPVKVIDPAPATGENVGAPQPDVEALGGEATVIAPGAIGKVSLKA